MAKVSAEIRFDVALSFAGEDREFVRKVARSLGEDSIRVFYDEDEIVETWGKNLVDYLDDIYRVRSHFVVIFISKHYANKSWANHERQSAMARALIERGEYILPARFDDTELEGLQPTIGYIDLRKETPESFAKTLIEKIKLSAAQSGETTLPMETRAGNPMPGDIQQYENESERLKEASKVFKEIQMAPHWAVTIRPVSYRLERIESLPNCYHMIDSCRIARNNWEFPFLRPASIQTGNDWVGGSETHYAHKEYCRIYQSGQVVFFSAFREDFFPDDVKKQATYQIPIPEDFDPTGFRDIFLILEMTTAVFEFASRYVRHGLCNDGVSIGIHMHGVKDNVLFCWERNRHWYSFYSTSDDLLGKTWILSEKQIEDETQAKAIQAANFFYHRFGWFKAPLKDLADYQRGL